MDKFLKTLSLGLLLGTAYNFYWNVTVFVAGELREMFFKRPEDDDIEAQIDELEARCKEINTKIDAVAQRVNA